jgi:hypothetical protein
MANCFVETPISAYILYLSLFMARLEEHLLYQVASLARVEVGMDTTWKLAVSEDDEIEPQSP